MTEQAAAAPPAPSGPGAFGRVAGVFFSPVRTFRAIAQRPTWLAPVLVWTVLSLAITTIVLPRIDFEKMIRSRMEKRGQTIPEDRLASIVETQKRIAPIAGYGFAAATPAVICLLTAAVLLGAFKAFGSDLVFRQSFGVTTHAFLP